MSSRHALVSLYMAAIVLGCNGGGAVPPVGLHSESRGIDYGQAGWGITHTDPGMESRYHFKGFPADYVWYPRLSVNYRVDEPRSDEELLVEVVELGRPEIKPLEEIIAEYKGLSNYIEIAVCRNRHDSEGDHPVWPVGIVVKLSDFCDLSKSAKQIVGSHVIYKSPIGEGGGVNWSHNMVAKNHAGQFVAKKAP